MLLTLWTIDQNLIYLPVRSMTATNGAPNGVHDSTKPDVLIVSSRTVRAIVFHMLMILR